MLICDALLGIRTGGPYGTPQFVANTILMSQDIVAVDYWGVQLLLDNGWNELSEAGYIETAASTYELGTNDPTEMDVITITNPSGASASNDNAPAVD